MQHSEEQNTSVKSKGRLSGRIGKGCLLEVFVFLDHYWTDHFVRIFKHVFHFYKKAYGLFSVDDSVVIRKCQIHDRPYFNLTNVLKQHTISKIPNKFLMSYLSIQDALSMPDGALVAKPTGHQA